MVFVFAFLKLVVVLFSKLEIESRNSAE